MTYKTCMEFVWNILVVIVHSAISSNWISHIVKRSNILLCTLGRFNNDFITRLL